MKKSRYTQEQIAYVLRQAEAGTPVADVCRGVGISEATFYVWKKKYAGLGVSELRRLKLLRGREHAPEAPGGRSDAGQAHPERGDPKKALKPSRRKEITHWIREQFKVSTVRACRLGGISRAGWYRKSTAKDQTALRMRIREIALDRPRFGFQRIHIVLRREGWKVNPKRVHWLYRLEGLQVRMRVRRRKRLSLHRGPAPRPTGLGERWSMDFVHDQLADGRAFRVLTVVDNWSRESVLLEAGFRLTGESVAAALSRVARHRPLPRSITVDHGTEFTSRALDQWAWENGVLLDFTRPGKPTDNGLCKSFNGRLRDECLNVHQFGSIEQARQKIQAWRVDYNDHRPHGALGHLTPSEYARSGRKGDAEGAPLQFRTVY